MTLQALTGLMLASQQPMFIMWGPDRLWLNNDAFTPILGRKHPSALGRPGLEVWSEARVDLEPLFDKVFAGEPVHMDNITLQLDRRGRLEEAHFAYSYTPARDETGAVAGLFGVCTETTQQVLETQRADDERARLAELFEQAPGFMCMLRGPDHVFELANPAYRQLLGHRDLVGKPVREAAPEVEGQGFFELLDQVYRSGKAFSTTSAEIFLQPQPGASLEPRFLDYVFQPIKTPSGAVTGIFVEGFDVTERALAEAARDATEAELRELNAELERRVEEKAAERDRVWRASQDLLAVIGPDGVIQAANPAWRTILGWAEEEVVGRHHLDFSHPDDHRENEVAFERAIDDGLPAHEGWTLHRDGTYRRISWVAASEDGRVYASGRHVTAEYEGREELARAQEALRQSQKMEAVGQLTGGIAHDFNNLLTGIIGSLEILAARLGQGRFGDFDRYIGTAQESARRAAALTQRLLAFARRQTLDPRPVDVNRMIAGMSDLINRTVGPNVKVEVVQAVGLWPTRLDPSQLESALLNLCLNARDAMAPNGGSITIETANKWLDGRAAGERHLPPGQYISLCVTDTGCGMPPDVIAKAFDPFFTTKPLGQGTGLGLSMIYGFVRQSGGQVRVYSEVGKGTTMCLYLPRFVGATDVEEPAQDAHLDRGEGETVLIIDDEPAIRMLVSEVLTENGYRVMEANDGPEGLKVLQGDRRVDFLITDVGLPGGLNGRQVADAARQTRPGLKVLFITGFAENAVVGGGHLEPGMSVITKPFAMAALANKVRELIDT